MLARYRQRRKYLSIVLLIAIATMSVGFSAFTKELEISAKVNVSPDASSFRVEFSSDENTTVAGDVDGVPVGGAVAGTAKIENDNLTVPVISNLTATFTNVGQEVSYTFYARNAGFYDAFLNEITFNNVANSESAKVCEFVNKNLESTTEFENACNDIVIDIQVGDTFVDGTAKDINNHVLGQNTAEKVIVTISYLNNNNKITDDFIVNFGDIVLSYSSADN